MMHEVRATLPVSGRLFGVIAEPGRSVLFAVEAADSLEAGRRVAVIALMLGIANLSRGTVQELDSEFDVSSIPTFYQAYFCDENLSSVAGKATDYTVH
jgi:hypothetical protein